jgi:hypothetical protein
MNIEEHIRLAVEGRAAAIEVEDRPWSDVLRRVELYQRRRRTRRIRFAGAAALVALVLVSASIAFRGERRSPDRVVVSDPVRHVPTGPPVVLEQGETGAGAWSLVEVPTTEGPCVGVQAQDAERLSPTTPPGWPQIASQCAPDIDMSGDVVFVVGLRTAAGVMEPFVMGITSKGTRPLRIFAGDAVADVRPVSLGGRVAAFAVPVPQGVESIDIVRLGDARPYARGVPILPFTDSPAVVVGESEDRIASAFYNGSGQVCMFTRQRGAVVVDPSSIVCPSDAGPWPPPSSGSEYEVSVVTPAGVRRVDLLGPAGQVVATVPTFGCDAGFPACFVFAVTKDVAVGVRPAQKS